MENRKVALLLFAMTILIAFVAWSHDSMMGVVADASCGDAAPCPMREMMGTQRLMAAAVCFLFLAASATLIVRNPSQAGAALPELALPPDLGPDERKVLGLINSNGGSLFQGIILKECGFSKVKVSRILDRLEGRELVERKRRGMSNLVVARACVREFPAGLAERPPAA